jgi:hypothetical protein
MEKKFSREQWRRLAGKCGICIYRLTFRPAPIDSNQLAAGDRAYYGDDCSGARAKVKGV